MKWITRMLRPEAVPPASKKRLSFGTRVRMGLYRNRLLRLRKYYALYAFSDMVALQGRPGIKVVHERRDPVFEAELRRMKLLPPDQTKARTGLTATGEKEPSIRLCYKEFRFVDTLTLTMGGQTVCIHHGEEADFRSAIEGVLKESLDGNLIQRYQFAGIPAVLAKESEDKPSRKGGNLSASISDLPRSSHTGAASKTSEGPSKPPAGPSKPVAEPPQRPAKTGPLFGDDPLLGQTHPGSAPAPAPEPPKSTKKTVAGVVIDESF